jgi:hypothetical protein
MTLTQVKKTSKQIYDSIIKKTKNMKTKAKPKKETENRRIPQIRDEDKYLKLLEIYKNTGSKRGRNIISTLYPEFPKFVRTLIEAPMMDFYPTPLNCLDTNNIKDVLKRSENILEPSAGLGSMMYFIKKENPKVMITAYEWNTELYNFLIHTFRKKVNIINDNFLESNSKDNNFDTIFCNPPFTLKGDKKYYFNFLFKCFEYMYNSSHYYKDIIFICPFNGLNDENRKVGQYIDPNYMLKNISYNKIVNISEMLKYQPPTKKDYNKLKDGDYVTNNPFIDFLENIFNSIQIQLIDKCKFQTTKLQISVYHISVIGGKKFY